MNATFKGYSKLGEKLSKNTHFTCEEADALLNMYESICGNTKMDGNKFRDVMHGIFAMTDDTMMEHIYQVFDMDQDGQIGAEEFVLCMSTFLKGTLKEKIDYCYSVYDHNGDGCVSREEMIISLKSNVLSIPPGEELEEVVKDLVEIVVKKLDEDKDGRVSYEDYATSVQKEPLLLEAFGTCLPEPQARDKFMDTFMEKYGRKNQEQEI